MELASQTASILVEMVSRGTVADDREASTLEQIIVSEIRPAVPMRGGQIGMFPKAWKHLNDSKTRAVLEQSGAAVGQIYVKSTECPQPLGAAFLVAEDLVVTARHIAEIFASGRGMGAVRFRDKTVTIDFAAGDPMRALISRVVRIEMIHPVLDIAILRLEARTEFRSLPLWSCSPGELEERTVAVIANPVYNPQDSSDLQKYIFSDQPGIKRVMVGKVLPPRSVSSFGQQRIALAHDCLALVGSSGAPVIDIETGRVVGISFAGEYPHASFAVPVSDLAGDSRIWKLGLRFLDASEPTSARWDDEWREVEKEPVSEPAVKTSEIPRGTKTDTIFEAARQALKDRFEGESFRKLLADHGLQEVLNALPSKADDLELLRALKRRGLLNEGFLQQLGVFGTANEPVVLTSDSAWLPESLLNEVQDALKNMPRNIMDTVALGSQWREHFLSSDCLDHPFDVIQRLNHQERPSAGNAVAWLLRRLYETIDGPENEVKVKVLRDAVSHVEARLGIDSTRVGEGMETLLRTDPPAMQSIEYLEKGMQAARGVGLIRISDKQDSRGGGGTAWLIAPRLLVVPAHLFHIAGKAGANWDFQKALQIAPSYTVSFDFKSPRHPGENYSIQRLLWADPGLDLAILELHEPVKGRRPLILKPYAVDPKTAVLSIIHHPFLGPQQISRAGRLLRYDGHEALYMLDTAPGSAGGPIFDEHWRVVATHRAFTNFRLPTSDAAYRAKLGTATSALLATLREGKPEIWSEVLAHQPQMKLADAHLQKCLESMQPTEKVPIIVQLTSAKDELQPIPGFEKHPCSPGFASGLASRDAIEKLAASPQVQSIELSQDMGNMECEMSVPHIGAANLHGHPFFEEGDGAIIAIIDTGIDILHECFRKANGETRILAFWDQHDIGSEKKAFANPKGEVFNVPYGALYLASDINKYINGEPLPPTFPAARDMAHGTSVSSIAAGRASGVNPEKFGGGVAPGASLIVVRYDLQNATVGYSKGHMDALDFIEKFAGNTPVVVNISNGMNAGAHDGTSTVEKYCDLFTGAGGKPGRIIVKSAGNERTKGRHAEFSVQQNHKKSLRWQSSPQSEPIVPGKPEVIELWFDSAGSYQFQIVPPSGKPSPYITSKNRAWKETLENGNEVEVSLNVYHADNGQGRLTLSISPGRNGQVEKGVWRLEILCLQTSSKTLHAWIEGVVGRAVYFLDFISDEITVTIPGTAAHVISVGAIEVSEYVQAYELSSWGPARNGAERPDIAAPGVNIYPSGAGRRNLRTTSPISGTSLAAPHVTGAIALALSACVKAGREPHHTYRIRAALRDTARPGTRQWSNETGYGALDALAFYNNLADT